MESLKWPRSKWCLPTASKGPNPNMTTIAIRAGIIAYDSRVCEQDGTVRPVLSHKAIMGKNHPVIYAGGGWTSEIASSWRKLEAMKTLPWNRKLKPNINLGLRDDETEIFIMYGSGEVMCIDQRGWYMMEGPFIALGTGKDAALGAMHMGADAQRAVEIATLVDNRSGPPVHSLKAVDIVHRA
jgi:hypothetical protein